MSTLPPPRTYNQNHVPRAHTGGRRISIYWTWSYPWEAQRDPAIIENRFSTMTEVRNVLWPAYETPEYGTANFLQGVAGTMVEHDSLRIRLSDVSAWTVTGIKNSSAETPLLP